MSFEIDSKIEFLPPTFGGTKLKQNNLFATLKINTITDDILAILVLNVMLPSKHIDDIVFDKKIKYNDII